MAMNRILACFGLVAALLASPVIARAGDTAEVNVLGFTPDGKVFAFEEFGTQDGSGFPYANRFYIDPATDKFLPGTPIRVRIDDESADVETARKQAADQAQKILPDANLSPAYLAAFNAVTEESADPFRIVANPMPVFPPITDSIGIKLEEIGVPLPAACEGQEGIKGFKLSRFDPATNATTGVMHLDKSIPASRNCPQGYRLSGLYTWPNTSGGGVFAVLIAVRGVGFEGPDYRFIAVTGKL